MRRLRPCWTGSGIVGLDAGRVRTLRDGADDLRVSGREAQLSQPPAASCCPTAVELVEPTLDRLPGYAAALDTGWSPSTTRDVSAEQLAALRADADGFLRGLTQRKGGGTIASADGTMVPRLPGRVLWLWDGAFCGAINLRFVPGTLDLPPHVSGHVGYAVVPWKRGRGYATQALALLLPVACELGLPRVLVTCDASNAASRRVIEANGGVLADTISYPDRPGYHKLLFWIATAT